MDYQQLNTNQDNSQGFNAPPQQQQGFNAPPQQQGFNAPPQQQQVNVVQGGPMNLQDLTVPVSLKCGACNRVQHTRVETETPALYACLWCLGFGLIGCLSYMLCCKKAHEYKHYCSGCGHLITTKEAECCNCD